MHRTVVAVALLVGCRGDHSKSSPPPVEGVSPAADLPKLPMSADGTAALRELDASIDAFRRDATATSRLISALLERAGLTQHVEDYVEALERSGALVELVPENPGAWKVRITALSRVHRFSDARAALDKLKLVAEDPNDWKQLAATLDEATGHPELAAPLREETAKILVRPETLTMLAGNLALRGKLDDAIALVPKAAASAHDNPAVLYAWLYFQWGRLSEQAGQMARARDLFAEAHRRMPGYLEAVVHLAQTMTATGQDPTRLVAEALAANRHPELLALAGKTAEARTEWERYLAALPLAFSDHAARFYLGPGANPARALELARSNLANRDTAEARSLVVEAALAAHDPALACAQVDPLFTAPLRSQQFVAWRAVSACGRKADADRLATTLGIR